MPIEPSDIIFQNDGGTGNMGTLTFGSDSDMNNKARFGLEGRFALKFLRILLQQQLYPLPRILRTRY